MGHTTDMANGYKAGDDVVIRKNVLTGTTSDELTRVFHIEEFVGGSMARGYLLRQGRDAVQEVDWQDDIERLATEDEVRHASTTGRA